MKLKFIIINYIFIQSYFYCEKERVKIFAEYNRENINKCRLKKINLCHKWLLEKGWCAYKERIQITFNRN